MSSLWLKKTSSHGYAARDYMHCFFSFPCLFSWYYWDVLFLACRTSSLAKSQYVLTNLPSCLMYPIANKLEIGWICHILWIIISTPIWTIFASLFSQYHLVSCIRTGWRRIVLTHYIFHIWKICIVQSNGLDLSLMILCREIALFLSTTFCDVPNINYKLANEKKS